MQMHTTAFWLTMPESVAVELPAGRAAAIDALRGAGRALETVATLALMCDPRDLGCTLGDAADGPRRGYSPTLYLYEHVPGGTGLSERIFEQREVLIGRARTLIERCPCVAGCPACVGPSETRDGSATRKAVAVELLRIAALRPG
jgi:DEAD/DEAH box helicase domain-containing protein